MAYWLSQTVSKRRMLVPGMRARSKTPEVKLDTEVLLPGSLRIVFGKGLLCVTDFCLVSNKSSTGELARSGSLKFKHSPKVIGVLFHLVPLILMVKNSCCLGSRENCSRRMAQMSLLRDIRGRLKFASGFSNSFPTHCTAWTEQRRFLGRCVSSSETSVEYSSEPEATPTLRL